jgi:two-component system response regulator
MVDDDSEDCLLVQDALREVGSDYDIRFVRDGEELLEYLRREGEYASEWTAPFPDLILMDMRMPRMDGREAMRVLRSDPRWRRIPVVAFTTSTVSDDILLAYESGVNSYVTKPTTFRGLVETMRVLCDWWFAVVDLPPRPAGKSPKKASEVP